MHVLVDNHDRRKMVTGELCKMAIMKKNKCRICAELYGKKRDNLHESVFGPGKVESRGMSYFFPGCGVFLS